ncbi:carboxylate--amine ligase [Pediococcus pentosaceus]|jgi:D-aspartate ligase|uniref:D-aspartate ligase n=1 Tax=Pediococcus pentosaceus TaxID=1255 RepID=A0A1Y0VZY6_PEDPE|nr:MULTISPECIES: carboxylate--amine ligase [Pediococcus]ARW20087.1 D-aspartate ligase [Pediococcus pentosaceus]KAF5440762.1 carboxylate--amine ligase [Pediococcus sp. EKM202D]KAF5441675.1 carboxylate--amine ligase [Pediococcus sp. EKM201D]MCT3021344.1 carboxylate--amine ligase [Pediococcus pentosaceus]MCT3023022.1 carboxylate--amine ligase [Pediococcus pentosaceus]
MERPTNNFTPILLGSDFNAYGMARSFYEITGRRVQAYAGTVLAPTRFTKIVNVDIIPGFSEDPVFIESMRKIAKKYENSDEKVVLLGMGDGYAELISKHKEELSKTFICPYIDYDLLKQLNNKERFYSICDEYNLPYPATHFITKAQYESGEKFISPFEFPVALKPADSVEWLDIHFEGRKKAFRIKTQAELDEVIGKIYDNGYTSDLILQDFIPGDDSNMRVLNAYVDQNHQVKMMCLGHPLLEDPAPSAIGNYVTIIPEFNQEIYDTVKNFLESINYVGYANFDMKYDSRDGKFKLFEINIRQGRSSFFVTLNGYNLARWVVEDRVNNALADRETVYANDVPGNWKLWLGVPVKVFKKYAKNNDDKQKALELINNDQYGFTAIYDEDMNFKRSLLMWWMNHNYVKNFRKYFKENKG